jgi:hypothetical protein
MKKAKLKSWMKRKNTKCQSSSQKSERNSSSSMATLEALSRKLKMFSYWEESFKTPKFSPGKGSTKISLKEILNPPTKSQRLFNLKFSSKTYQTKPKTDKSWMKNQFKRSKFQKLSHRASHNSRFSQYSSQLTKFQTFKSYNRRFSLNSSNRFSHLKSPKSTNPACSSLSKSLLWSNK